MEGRGTRRCVAPGFAYAASTLVRVFQPCCGRLLETSVLKPVSDPLRLLLNRTSFEVRFPLRRSLTVFLPWAVDCSSLPCFYSSLLSTRHGANAASTEISRTRETVGAVVQGNYFGE